MTSSPARRRRWSRHPASWVLHALDRLASRPSIAALVVALDLLWVVFSARFEFPPRLESVFQTMVAAVTLAMVFVIQHTQARQQVVTQRKLDEILRALPEADRSLITLETAPDDKIHEVARRHASARDTYDDAMPVDVLTSIEIARPRAEVAAFAADPDNATRWYTNIRSVEWRTAPPAVVGSRMAFVASFLGRRLEYTYEIRELEPATRLVMSTSEGAFPMETTYTWEDTADGGTRMTLRNRGEPSGFSRVAAPAMEAAMRRANRKDLALLKQVLEG